MWQQFEAGAKRGYKELCKSIITAIEVGHLKPGTPLPPTRALATTLGVSRDTILHCYQHLQTLGYLESDATRGTYVSHTAEIKEVEPEVAQIDFSKLSRYAQEINSRPSYPLAPDFPNFNYGGVPREALPINRWREIMQERTKLSEFKNINYAINELGQDELREALAGYLGRANGIPAKAENVAVFNISFAATALLCRLLLEPGDVIAVEDPGFGGIRNVADYHNLTLYPVPVDEQGLVVEELKNSPKPVKLVYVTADHQDPLGCTMSLERRKQLLAWAKENNGWIVEDNYDGFFHYGTKLPPSLYALDQDQCVIHLATFWQVLYPLNSICYLLMPAPLMPVLAKSKVQTESLTETMVQLGLADVLRDGFLQKHMRKIERTFATKRRQLIFELKQHLGQKIWISSQSGGLTILLRIDQNDWNEDQVVGAARKSGLPLISIARHYIRPAPGGEYTIYFAGLPAEDKDLKEMIGHFAKTLKGSADLRHD